MPLDGSRLGHFTLLEKIGEGGMGVVYKARDTRLERVVAIKLLPESRAADAGRCARFIHEAKAASALNHPNIVTIHEVGEQDGLTFMVMEFVDGKPLNNLIPRKGMRLTDALRVAAQVADALTAAHAASIVHRDLKPGNIMVDSQGRVKVLDFGLAKLAAPAIAVAADEETRTAPLTEEGAIAGSVPYMSPEQAEGRPVDVRSDIFSFGAVLYEMLTGQRAFRGETRASTLAAVVEKEPQPVSETGTEVPPELERLVARCLRKDVNRRSQHMSDVKLALEELLEESHSGTAHTSGQPARGRTLWKRVSSGLAAALLVGLVYLRPWTNETIALNETLLTTYAGYNGSPTISPDGTHFAFEWDGYNQSNTRQIYVSLVGRGSPLQLTRHQGGGYYPAFSPDGQAIAYVGSEEHRAAIFLIPALGGRAIRLADRGTSGLTWSPDGRWLVLSHGSSREDTRRSLFIMPSTGGSEGRLTDPPIPANDGDGAFSPDGRQIVFVRSLSRYTGDLYAISIREGRAIGQARRITTDQREKSSPVWTANGKEIVFVAGERTSERRIYRVNASGGPLRRIEGIGDDAKELAISWKGHRLIYSKERILSNLWRMSLVNRAARPEKILSSTRFDSAGAYSPDGKRIAFSSSRGGVRQIWTADADGSNAVPLTSFDRGVAGLLRWSPDGHTIAFDARPEGNSGIYVISAEGGTPKLITEHPANDSEPCWSADGRWIYFGSNRAGKRQIYRVPASGGEVQLIAKTGGTPIASPDGKWLYYAGDDGIIRWVPAEGGQETTALSGVATHGDSAPLRVEAKEIWVTAEGIYYGGAFLAAEKKYPVYFYRLADGRTETVVKRDNPPWAFLSVSADGKWLVYSQVEHYIREQALVENFR